MRQQIEDASPFCKLTCLACTLAVTLASVIMLACSFDTLSPHEIGLHYNAPAVKLYSKTYDNGRYFLSLGHRFLKVCTLMMLNSSPALMISCAVSEPLGVLRVHSRHF
jgi:hypothetical protein